MGTRSAEYPSFIKQMMGRRRTGDPSYALRWSDIISSPARRLRLAAELLLGQIGDAFEVELSGAQHGNFLDLQKAVRRRDPEVWKTGLPEVLDYLFRRL